MRPAPDIPQVLAETDLSNVASSLSASAFLTFSAKRNSTQYVLPPAETNLPSPVGAHSAFHAARLSSSALNDFSISSSALPTASFVHSSSGMPGTSDTTRASFITLPFRSSHVPTSARARQRSAGL